MIKNISDLQKINITLTSVKYMKMQNVFDAKEAQQIH